MTALMVLSLAATVLGGDAGDGEQCATDTDCADGFECVCGLSGIPGLNVSNTANAAHSSVGAGAVVGTTVAMMMNERTSFTNIALGASIGAAMAAVTGADASEFCACAAVSAQDNSNGADIVVALDKAGSNFTDDKRAYLSITTSLDVDLTTLDAAEFEGLKNALVHVASTTGGFDASAVARIDFYQGGVLITSVLNNRNRREFDPIEARVILKQGAEVNLTAVTTNLKNAGDAGTLSVNATIGGVMVTAEVTAKVVAIESPKPAPTPAPTPEPTPAPTAAPTAAPTPAPTAAPTPAPTPEPCTQCCTQCGGLPVEDQSACIAQ